ncbi:AMP-binding protein [Sneathiella chungangensis]|nr:AMP-binding protein [Sneathiella chungangensis]
MTGPVNMSGLSRAMVTGEIANWGPAGGNLPDVTVYDTLPKLLRKNAQDAPNEVAQREKDFGIWNEVTWRDFNDHVSKMAVAMREMGVEAGGVVALIGDNRPEWVWGEVAAHATGAMSMGIYREALEDEILYLLNYTKPLLVIAEDEEQVDKLLNLGDRIPYVQRIVYSDPRGMSKYDDERLWNLERFEEAGAAALKSEPELYDRMVDATNAEDVAILCTTSGTTSNPKLAMWQSRAFLGHAVNYLKADPKDSSDEYLSILPLSWVMEQMYAVGWNMIARMTVNFPEEESTAMADMREIGPSFVLLSPRVWEIVAAEVRARMMESTPWKQAIYYWAEKRGMEAVSKGQKDGLSEWLLFRALRDRLGFSNLKSAATGGAAMGPEIFKFFQAMGVPLKQLYGQTEGLGAYTIHKNGAVDYNTVGFPFPNCTLQVKDPDVEGVGEILVKHPHMMLGYYKNEEATREVFDAEGYFHTGDAGYLDENKHLVVIDRISDLAETSEGVRFSPQFIENKIKFSTFIAEAVIVGKDRPYLTAIICIRYPIVSKWAEQKRIAFTTYTDLAARPEVYEMMRAEVERVNADLLPAQRIKKFVLLYKELDADDGELTRTKKVRRKVIAEKYADIIGNLYSDTDYVDIDTVISFQDGTKQRIKTKLKVEKLGDAA